MLTVGVSGCAGIKTSDDASEIHPASLVTVKLYVPPGRLNIVLLVPVPEVNTPPGYLINVQMPEDGKLFSTTLPVDREHVGEVMFNTVGATGVTVWAEIKTFADGGDKQPASLVTV